MKPPDAVPCLSVRFPWSALLLDPKMKDCENRSRRMGYRGRLLIHSAKTWDIGWCRQHVPLTCTTEITPWILGYILRQCSPRGEICGSVFVVDCRRERSSPWHEPDSWGIYIDPDRTDCWPCEKWVPYRGLPGLFYVPRSSLPQGVRTDGF